MAFCCDNKYCFASKNGCLPVLETFITYQRVWGMGGGGGGVGEAMGGLASAKS